MGKLISGIVIIVLCCSFTFNRTQLVPEVTPFNYSDFYYYTKGTYDKYQPNYLNYRGTTVREGLSSKYVWSDKIKYNKDLFSISPYAVLDTNHQELGSNYDTMQPLYKLVVKDYNTPIKFRYLNQMLYRGTKPTLFHHTPISLVVYKPGTSTILFRNACLDVTEIDFIVNDIGSNHYYRKYVEEFSKVKTGYYSPYLKSNLTYLLPDTYITYGELIRYLGMWLKVDKNVNVQKDRQLRHIPLEDLRILHSLQDLGVVVKGEITDYNYNHYVTWAEAFKYVNRVLNESNRIVRVESFNNYPPIKDFLPTTIKIVDKAMPSILTLEVRSSINNKYYNKGKWRPIRFEQDGQYVEVDFNLNDLYAIKVPKYTTKVEFRINKKIILELNENAGWDKGLYRVGANQGNNTYPLKSYNQKAIPDKFYNPTKPLLQKYSKRGINLKVDNAMYVKSLVQSYDTYYRGYIGNLDYYLAKYTSPGYCPEWQWGEGCICYDEK